jgi:hypothetical protein
MTAIDAEGIATEVRFPQVPLGIITYRFRPSRWQRLSSATRAPICTIWRRLTPASNACARRGLRSRARHPRHPRTRRLGRRSGGVSPPTPVPRLSRASTAAGRPQEAPGLDGQVEEAPLSNVWLASSRVDPVFVPRMSGSQSRLIAPTPTEIAPACRASYCGHGPLGRYRRIDSSRTGRMVTMRLLDRRRVASPGRPRSTTPKRASDDSAAPKSAHRVRQSTNPRLSCPGRRTHRSHKRAPIRDPLTDVAPAVGECEPGRRSDQSR